MIEAERLGYDSVWTAESYGSDALTPLAWWGSRTERVRLGTSLCQLSGAHADGHGHGGADARPPVGRPLRARPRASRGPRSSRAGTASRSPRRWPAPASTSTSCARCWPGEQPVTNDGPHYPLPYPGGTGLGKPLKPIVHPLRADVPIILGAEGPKNVALAAEIADGWFPIFFSPKAMSSFEASLDEGFARPGRGARAADFEILAFAPTVMNDDVDAAADGFRPMLALYIGGMGAKDMNFHFDVFARMGYEEAAHKIQDAYLDGRKDDAAAAVPTSMVEDIALVGPGREDPRRPRGVARVAGDDDARERRPDDDADDGGARARLNPSWI